MEERPPCRQAAAKEQEESQRAQRFYFYYQNVITVLSGGITPAAWENTELNSFVKSREI